MDKHAKQRLMDLGTEALADILLDLAKRHDSVNGQLERLMAPPQENLKRLKAKLATLKRRRQAFITCRESGGFAHDLETLLDDLQTDIDDPRTGLELVARFYEADQGICNSCDDSNGVVGWLFKHNAKTLFANYAARCMDKDWLTDLVLQLIGDNDYGVRDTLTDGIADYLPESNIRTMIARCQELASQETDNYKKRHWNSCIGDLARQIKDAPLFEKTLAGGRTEVPPGFCIDIARVYLECGDAKTALAWIERVPKDSRYHRHDCDKLLLDIHDQLGDPGKKAETAWRIFRNGRGVHSLNDLLAIIGPNQKDSVIASETATILGEKRLSLVDAIFLVELECFDDAETYLIDRASQLNGDDYSPLLSMAKTLENANHPLAASILYRALLDSILRRAQSTIYSYAASYLKKLDKLASAIPDWRGIPDHPAYTEHLRQQHQRKQAFWSKYNPINEP
jgi:hypothetical protein